MKKTGLLMAACLVWPACTNEPRVANNEFLIEGTLENVADGKIIELYIQEGDVGKRVAQDTLRNGHFSFGDTIATLQRYSLLLIEGEDISATHDIWIEPGKIIYISGKDANLPLWEIESDIREQNDQNQMREAAREEWERLAPLTAKEKVRLLPPLIITKEELKKAVGILKEVIGE